MDIPSIINYAGDIADAISVTVPKIITTSAVLAALLPPPEGTGVLSRLHGLINIVGFNFWHARNK